MYHLINSTGLFPICPVCCAGEGVPVAVVLGPESTTVRHLCHSCEHVWTTVEVGASATEDGRLAAHQQAAISAGAQTTSHPSVWS